MLIRPCKTTNPTHIVYYLIPVILFVIIVISLLYQEHKDTSNSVLENVEGKKRINIPRCKCTNLVEISPEINENETIFKHTTCSKESFQRGLGQKVFSYSFYGEPNSEKSSRKYFEGIEMNAVRIAELFPGWTMRVYHNVSGREHDETMCGLVCKHDNLDLCDVTENPMVGDMSSTVLPTIWRFMPLVDEQVAVVNFRDLDSLVGAREMSAVGAWVLSKHPLHVMRDHPSHDMPILAGMWGAKVEPLRGAWRKIMGEILKSGISRLPFTLQDYRDQVILERYVWSWGQFRALQHDSFHCALFTKTTPWPTRREEEEGDSNYVGAPFAINSSVDQECPERCRPREHKDWKLC